MPFPTHRQARHDAPLSFELNDRDQTLRLWIAAILIVGLTVVHYITDSHAVAFHNVYRRLYYIPIVLAAFSWGVKGGVGAAVISSVFYIPHAFFMTHADPSPAIDKVLEMVLYVGIGGLTGWLVSRQNEIRRALERSLAERDMLEESLVRAGKLSALGQLTSGLAHEIRNPLAAILGSAETLVAEFDPSHRKYRMGQLLLQEIDRLNRVVSDFLEFARPGEPQQMEVNPVALAKEVFELTAARARELDIAVDISHAEVPPRLLADPDQVRQVLLNFFLNAYQALEERASTDDFSPEIELLSEQRKVGARSYFCLGLRDNGPGVPGDIREKIFDPYFTTRLEGSGLGLSVSARIAETHGGFVDVTDASPGAIFWLCLPEISE
ncbi:sensor histidine kinase [Bradymonas sediminis]|nr:ATP-binding protein [Bradymonas sediminis]TDP63649.1 histidine kinase/DNA gyrase B/HSP90-like ATPase [Bradymonas sediminis]